MPPVVGRPDARRPHPRTLPRRQPIRGLTSGRLRAARISIAISACVVAVSAGTAQARPDAKLTPADAPPASRAELVAYAKRFLGTPYRWGGATPGGFDCSGLTSYVYARFGVKMDHYTGAQYDRFRKVPRSALQPGDLVFFAGLGHVGMYVGSGRFIHATHSGDVVRISRLNEGWYRTTYVGAVRPPLDQA